MYIGKLNIVVKPIRNCYWNHIVKSSMHFKSVVNVFKLITSENHLINKANKSHFILQRILLMIQ